MNSLFKLFVVDDGSNLALAVGSPEGCGHFNPGFTSINSEKKYLLIFIVNNKTPINKGCLSN
jgi:hypothetical protein